MKAKWMKTSYIKHEVYDRLSVSEARLMCLQFLYSRFSRQREPVAVNLSFFAFT